MKQLYRAIRRTFKQRLLIAYVIVCALMIGILWGGNIGAVVYPIMEISLKKETFVSWIDKQIEANQKLLAETQAAENSVAPLDSTPQAAHSQTFLQRKDAWLRWARPILLRCTPSDPFMTVVFLMAIILVGTIIKIFFIIMQNILAARIAQNASMEIRNEFFDKILNYEVVYFSREGISDTMSRFTNDMAILTGGLGILYGKVLREPLKMIACLGLAAYISWQLLFVTLLLVPLAAVSIRWLAKSIKRAVRRSMEEMARLYGRLEETFRSIRIVKAFTQENWEREKFQKTNRTYRDRAVKIAKYDALANPMTELFGILMICVAILVGAYLVMGDRTSIFGVPMLSQPLDTGMLVLFFALLAGAADPARKLSDIFTQFQSAAAAADRIYALIDREVPLQDPDAPKPLPSHQKSLRFDHVSFSYGDDRQILQDVSLEIPFGQCVAILGPSGCGKSTLLNLIPRFADPNGGQFLVDDQAVQEVTMQDLRRQIGLVTQDPVLFDDTVLANILYGCPSATREEAIEAAKKAFAHDFILNELSDGYETIVGPGGGQLSGGQRQRIALARAILRDPKIFLLDEATSQIDVGSEKMIHQALAEFKAGRTTIMVTHRLSAVSLADRIVLMEEGKITAQGKSSWKAARRMRNCINKNVMLQKKVQEKVAALRERMDAAAQRSSHPPGDIQLVAVSKYAQIGDGMIEALAAAECFELGEARPQLLQQKAEWYSVRQTNAALPLRWHLIGSLQRNKIRKILPHVYLIHSVDSLELAREISRIAVEMPDISSVRCLLEIDVSGDANKHGFSETEILAAVDFLGTLPKLHVEGLMCMSGLSAKTTEIHRQFASLRELREKLHEKGLPKNMPLNELSMGMSDDFEIAIEEGATMIRVGSLLYP